MSAAEIEALGGPSDEAGAAFVATVAVRVPSGELIDIPNTIALLRASAAFFEEQCAQVRAFGERTGAASYDESTDRWDE